MFGEGAHVDDGAGEAVKLPDHDHVNLPGLAVEEETVEGGAAPLGARDAGILGHPDDIPAPLLRHGLKLVELEANVLAVVRGGDAGVQGGSGRGFHARRCGAERAI